MTNSNLFLGNNRIHLEQVDSTNNYARSLMRDKMPIEGTVVTADRQEKGRGQRSNSWVTEPNLNLTCSYILRPAFLAAKNQFLLSATVALAVHDVVSDLTDAENITIKWPNDILVKTEKVSGILIENALRGMNLDNSIVGIGINVNQVNFQEGLHATSLKHLTNTEFYLEDVLNALSSSLEKRYLQLREGRKEQILLEFNSKLFAAGELRLLKVNGKEQHYRIQGVRPSGELQLEDPNGTNSLHQHHEIEWNLNG